MRKIWLALLVLIFFVLGSGMAMAADIFSDVPSNHWALKDIARMRAKGILRGVDEAQNLFGPKNQVTREMLVVMLIRVIGKEGEAVGDIPASFVQRDKVSPYAKGSMAYAVREGIISGSLLHSDPIAPVPRYEVAEIVVKAMGLASEAEAKKYDTLDYTDQSSIPLSARGAVKVMQEKGILGGTPEGSFKPNDSLTRDQIAAVLNRIDKELDKLSANTKVGKVYSLASSTIYIENANGVVEPVNLDNNVSIFKGGKIELTDLSKGDMIEVILDNNKAVYIEEGDFKLDTVVEGEITDVTGNIMKVITIKKDDGSTVTHTLSSTAQVTVNNQETSVSQLVVGQSVKATIKDNMITAIDIKDDTRIVSGVIESINLSADTITVESSDIGGRVTFIINDDTDIKISKKEVDLDELIEGMKVQVIAKGINALQIIASDLEQTITGVLVGVSFEPKLTLTIYNEETKEEETYFVDKDASIRRDRQKNLTLRDIYPDDEIEIDLENRYVTRIIANSVESKAQGTVQEVIIGASPALVIKTSDGDEERFNIASDAKIRKDGEIIKVTEIAFGDWVKLELEGKLATKVEVESKFVNRYVVGKVEDISSAIKGFYVIDHETQEEKLVLWNDDTTVVVGDRTRSMNESRLSEGDEVIVSGYYEGRYFYATTIVLFR